MQTHTSAAALASLVLGLFALGDLRAHDLKGLAAHVDMFGRHPDSLEPDARRDKPTVAPGTQAMRRKRQAVRDARDLIESASAQNPGNADRAALNAIVVRSLTWPLGSAVRICFHGGDSRVRAAIGRIAQDWTTHGNIHFDIGNPPLWRTCADGDSVPIRITFRSDGFWSLVGQEAIGVALKNGFTMGLENLDAMDPSSEYFIVKVRHEIGHALGFHHEHQSPFADCDAQFDKQRIMQETGWSDEKYRTNMSRLRVSSMHRTPSGLTVGTLPDGEEVVATDYDPQSIMHYALEERFFLQPPGRCFVSQNLVLSQQDRQMMQIAYPFKDAAQLRAEHNAGVEVLKSMAARPEVRRRLDVLRK